MKKIIILIGILTMFSCGHSIQNCNKSDKRFRIEISGFGTYPTLMYCDSFKMETLKTALIYTDGIELTVIADVNINVMDNPCYKN